jgi:hypothetical protein
MDKDTQLPAEVLDRINTEATIATDKEEIRLRGAYPDGAYGPMIARLNGFKQGVITCATEYATKLHQVEQENTQLKQWKKEQLLVWGPLYDYGLNSGELKVGGSIPAFILERCKQFDQACALLTEVLVMNEMWGDLPGEFIEKVKTFLDGAK